jgi:hypothetical protein
MTYEIQQTREEAEKAAAVKGCVCKRAAANELFLDIDSYEALDNFDRLFASFMAEEPAAEYVVTPSLEPLEKILLQAVLGSDPMRELLNWRRLVNDVPHDANNILFELAL